MKRRHNCGVFFYEIYIRVINTNIAKNIYRIKTRGGILMKDKDNKEIEKITYNLLGNAFVGNLLDMSGDADNSTQNLITYLELDEIKKLSKKDRK